MTNNIVYLASYPKSGNTWLRSILLLALTNTIDINKLGTFIPSFNQLLQNYYGHETNIPMNVVINNWDRFQQYLSNKNYRPIIKTHNACGKINKIYFPNKLYTHKVIYIVRDPRDVLISWANHNGRSLEETFNHMIDTEFTVYDEIDKASYSIEFMSSWDNHVYGWMECTSPTLIIKYEDLILDAENQILKILEFLKIKPKISIREIIERTSFDKLKEQERQDGFIEKQKGTNFFREGKAYGWKLHDFDFRKIEQRFMPLLKQLNYPVNG